MQYAMQPNSTMFVRVKKRAIKKDFVIRVSAANHNNFHHSKAFYVSELPKNTEPDAVIQYVANLAKRYNFANYQFVI